MRTIVPLKFAAHLLLLVILLGTVHGVHESAHALEGCGGVPAAGDAAVTRAACSLPHACPCVPPPAEHREDDGCDTCINCACHAPLGVQIFVLTYDPIIFSVRCSDPFTYLPEVFLPKFIPPQNLA